MLTDMEKRPYRLKKRAEHKEHTRLRIVEALVALHEEIGPRATTVSAVAERAGVERLTVYRHFPDMASMLAACTSHWLDTHPLPSLPADAADDAAEATRQWLTVLYRYYQRTAPMLDRSYRDAPEVPELREAMAGLDAFFDAARDRLLASWRIRGHARADLRAVLGHVLRFSTWQSLHAERLSAPAAAALACRWLQAAADARD